MNRVELEVYLDSTLEDALQHYSSAQGHHAGQAVPMNEEQLADWHETVCHLADLFSEAVHNLDWDRDERDI